MDDAQPSHPESAQQTQAAWMATEAFTGFMTATFEMAKAEGYVVRVVFVALRWVEQSIARVALRVSVGGHSIPEPDIRRRWPAVHANLTWFAAHADMLDISPTPITGSRPG